VSRFPKKEYHISNVSGSLQSISLSRWIDRLHVGSGPFSLDGQSASIRFGSWFQQSNLTLHEIMLITYDIVRREQASWIQSEYCLSSHTVVDWGMFCRETMVVFLEGSSVKIGGPNKTVEIDESKFGRRKYHRGQPVKGQWVFGGVERKSGEKILFPVPDRTSDTLMAIIRNWIEPGTTVISDSWAAYRYLGAHGYTHQTVNHSIQFVDPRTEAHTNTIESTWRSVKVFLGQYNRGEEYEFHLAHYMFAARCKAKTICLIYNCCISSPTPTGRCAVLPLQRTRYVNSPHSSIASRYR